MVVMNDSSVILVCTSGRSGSLYLNEVFKHHKTGEQVVLHEEGGRPPWREDLPGLAESGKGLILTGRNAIASLGVELAPYTPKVLHLVRNVHDVCMSWYERIPQDHYNPEHVAGFWPYGNSFSHLDRRWSEYQTYIWHWFSTYYAGLSLYPVHTTRQLYFPDLNDVDAMNAILDWLGMMELCNSKSLEQCLGAKNSRIKHRSGSHIDTEHEMHEWLDTMSDRSKEKVRTVARSLGEGYSI